MSEAFIVDYVRTPIGRFGGALSSVRADDLAAAPLKALLARHPGLDPASSRRSSTAAPIRPARTTAMSRAWRRCSRGFRRRPPA